jgi:transcriptional regulator with XRE-family HTH domain
MPRLKNFTPEKLADTRRASGLNQFDFWSRFGVTQSGGSRYESGRNIPLPTAMLVWLQQAGRITEKDLEDAKKAAKAGSR